MYTNNSHVMLHVQYVVATEMQLGNFHRGSDIFLLLLKK